MNPPDRSPALEHQLRGLATLRGAQELQRHVQDATAPLTGLWLTPWYAVGKRLRNRGSRRRPAPRQPQSLTLSPAVRTNPTPVFWACAPRPVGMPAHRAGWHRLIKPRRGATDRNEPCGGRSWSCGLRKSGNPKDPATWQIVTAHVWQSVESHTALTTSQPTPLPSSPAPLGRGNPAMARARVTIQGQWPEAHQSPQNLTPWQTATA